MILLESMRFTLNPLHTHLHTPAVLHGSWGGDRLGLFPPPRPSHLDLHPYFSTAWTTV